MATLQGANKTIIDAITPSTILSPGLQGGIVRVATDTYTGLGTESAADTIEMCGDIPKGATILWMVLRVNACGGTFDVGDAEDDNRYMDAAADNTVTTSTDLYASGVGYTITDLPGVSPYDSQILLRVNTGAVTAAGTATLVVFYTVE